MRRRGQFTPYSSHRPRFVPRDGPPPPPPTDAEDFRNYLNTAQETEQVRADARIQSDLNAGITVPGFTQEIMKERRRQEREQRRKMGRPAVQNSVEQPIPPELTEIDPTQD